MTRRWPCIIAAMLCCLFALATSSHAECAWVLWSRIESLDGKFHSDWSNGGAGGEVYPAYSACRARITRITGGVEEGSTTDWLEWLLSQGPYEPKWNPTAKDFIGSYRIPGGGVATKSQTHYSELKSLPDTIDPRGPKGK